MPRKRLHKKLNAKQININNKLMRIKIATDDYIYENGKISIEDAQDMRAQVSSLVEICNTDERKLQVLDTLSRILTGIIREQTLLEKQKTQSIRQKENDKSWVANIKYIRVIEKEEFDPTLKDLGSFWENCTFPKDWDENDFNID